MKKSILKRIVCIVILVCLVIGAVWGPIRKNRNIKGELSVDKNELISGLLSFKDNIGMWKIVLNQITDADLQP